ncbi:hypothetical protein BCR37DRAFT_383259 [Protomyces lactucae-debilis]|uniref:Secreted protein n=1 Tax=Protomyces lactucae-debilis TaxID=2754530 RepID=A0A1Y2EYQ7_PROLT|nr:uncharacterized protein BCR37DRAFT_383259 [Protomyces lactucae-debilis]ORY76627.1 hypothetical protein BCR37DRAFT_383259 [Protomyces lactucae-debilis]
MYNLHSLSTYLNMLLHLIFACLLHCAYPNNIHFRSTGSFQCAHNVVINAKGLASMIRSFGMMANPWITIPFEHKSWHTPAKGYPECKHSDYLVSRSKPRG